MTAHERLKERLRTDLTTAIKSRDEVRSSTLRMVLTSITNAEVAGKESRELTDEDVLGVLTSESKKRREAAEAFADAGRDAQADKEKAEAAVIADYLPEQLSAEEIDALVAADHRRARRARGRHARDGPGDGCADPEDQGPGRRGRRGCRRTSRAGGLSRLSLTTGRGRPSTRVGRAHPVPGSSRPPCPRARRKAARSPMLT